MTIEKEIEEEEEEEECTWAAVRGMGKGVAIDENGKTLQNPNAVKIRSEFQRVEREREREIFVLFVSLSDDGWSLCCATMMLFVCCIYASFLYSFSFSFKQKVNYNFIPFKLINKLLISFWVPFNFLNIFYDFNL